MAALHPKLHRPTGLTLNKIMNPMNRFVDLSISTGTDDTPPPPVNDPDADEDRVNAESSNYYDASHIYGDYGLRVSQGEASRVNLTSDQLPVERVSVFFDSTSSTNNLMMQMFEVDPPSSKLKKLDVINFGVLDDPNDPNHPRKNVFFAGKVFINTIGLPCFVNLFTIIMD